MIDIKEVMHPTLINPSFLCTANTYALFFPFEKNNGVQMISFGVVFNNSCLLTFIFLILLAIHRKWLKSINTFHPTTTVIDGLCITEPDNREEMNSIYIWVFIEETRFLMRFSWQLGVFDDHSLIPPLR